MITKKILSLTLAVLGLLLSETVLAQNADYRVIGSNTNNPSSLKITLKTFASKKKDAEIEAQCAALNTLLFDGLDNGEFKEALLPLTAKRTNADYLTDLYQNRLSDFVKSVRMLSEFHKAEPKEKSTLYEVIVDYNQLKRDVASLVIKEGASINSEIKQKKPTLMILPSDNWCSLRLYTATFDNQGLKVKVPNYVQAFQDDAELSAAISKVGGVLTGLGYSLKDAEQVLKTLNDRQAEDNITTSKNAGSILAESPLDNLKKRAKADIIIQLWWKVNKEPSGKSISFTLEAFDAYTNKRIGTSSATGNPSSEIVPVLLEQAIYDNVNEFDKQMTSFYDDINRNGREIVINIKRWESWDEDLESEFNGTPILEIIEDWLHENTVNDSFNLSDASDNFALFEQVRIPLTNLSGRSIDARNFVSGLQKYLKKDFGIPSKLMVRGLGETNLILGEQ